MPAKLTTTINKIQTIPNSTNAEIIDQFYHYMKGNDVSENHQNNCLNVIIALANFLGTEITFYDIKNKEQIYPVKHGPLLDQVRVPIHW
jgi:integrase/recombinase XerD